MTTVRIHHRTHYRYSGAVTLGVHRLMLRPRDGHDMRILDASLTFAPGADVRWEFDVFGNSVAYAEFAAQSDELMIESDLLLERYGFDDPVESLAPVSLAYPFGYSPDEQIDLAPYLRVECEADGEELGQWIASAVPVLPNRCLDLLEALTAAVHGGFTYLRREAQGVQTPGETLASGSGTCRDFAFLFIEAARQLGFAARFVTGYLYDPGLDDTQAQGDNAAFSGAGATHAWADVFVPGVGWLEFDPTNRIVASRNLIRVAATRAPAQALPVQGTFQPNGAEFLSMDVGVKVTLGG